MSEQRYQILLQAQKIELLSNSVPSDVPDDSLHDKKYHFHGNCDQYRPYQLRIHHLKGKAKTQQNIPSLFIQVKAE